jgi:DNA mismatch repair ATPase MutS
MIPLLQSIGLLDAYCSIAQLYKDDTKRGIAWSFVKFERRDVPYIDYSGMWLPLLLSLDKIVSNDLVFGGDNVSKIIVTGPNGGGKSTILKMLGINAILAQGWGINATLSARQTLFSCMYTSIATQESLKDELSTFMAEKKRMQELSSLMQNSNKNKHLLILIDEPYKGTVDDEAANRIYTFGKSIVPYTNSLVAITTHVKKPVLLAMESPSIFGNYHVRIIEKEKGKFERLFLLEQGPAMWWFDEVDKRSRFVDWLSDEITRINKKNKTSLF